MKATSIPVRSADQRRHQHTQSRRRCGRWAQTAWGLSDASCLRWTGRYNGLPANRSLVLWHAIIKRQQQISFLKLPKNESGNERVTSPGQLCPLKPASSLSCWLAAAPLREPLGLVQAASNSKWKGSPTKWPKCPQRGKTTTNSFTLML